MADEMGYPHGLETSISRKNEPIDMFSFWWNISNWSHCIRMLVYKHFQLIAITNKERCILGITTNLANALDTTLFAYSRVGALILFEIVWFVKLLQTWLWSMIPTVWAWNGCVQTTRIPSSFVFFLNKMMINSQMLGDSPFNFQATPSICFCCLTDGTSSNG